jgi:hypothetical protein
VKALGLGIGAEGAADVRAFVPANAEPGEVIEDSLGGAGDDARRIEVLHAEDERSAGLDSRGCAEDGGGGAAEVEEARGRGSESAAIGGHGEGASLLHDEEDLCKTDLHSFLPRGVRATGSGEVK